MFFLPKLGFIMKNLRKQIIVLSLSLLAVGGSSFAMEKRPEDVSAASASEKWACARCTFLNNSEAPICGSCDIPKPSPVGSWHCTQCTNLNEASDQTCRVCPSTLWHCSTCDYSHNKASAKKCDMCGAKSPNLKEGKTASPAACVVEVYEPNWECRYCTYQNNPEYCACDICGAGKSETVYY